MLIALPVSLNRKNKKEKLESSKRKRREDSPGMDNQNKIKAKTRKIITKGS